MRTLDYYLVKSCGDGGHHFFIIETDSAYFLSLLERLLINNKSVELTAYCLSTDRFDLLIHQINLGGVASLMHDIVINYNKYYFDKYAIDDILSESGYFASKVPVKDILKVSRKIHTISIDWLNHRYSSLRAYLYDDTPDWLIKTHISNLYGSAINYFNFLNNGDEE